MFRVAFTTAMMTAAVALGASGTAHAFNTYNGSGFPLCIYSSDHGGYFEKIGPGATSKGWAINKPMTLQLAVQDYSVCPAEGGNCSVVCNSYITSCTVQPHHQQYVGNIHFTPGNPQTNAGKMAAFAFGLAASYDVDCR